MVKRGLRRLLALLMRPASSWLEQRWTGRSFRILTYHRVSGHRPGDRLCVPPHLFAAHMEALVQRGATVISLSQAAACHAQGS